MKAVAQTILTSLNFKKFGVRVGFFMGWEFPNTSLHERCQAIYHVEVFYNKPMFLLFLCYLR